MHGAANDSELSAHETNMNELATPPPQNAPRPMTLPTRGAASRMRNRVFELNGTNVLLPAGGRLSIDDNCNQKSPSPSCESPSYLLNTHSTFYKFPATAAEEAMTAAAASDANIQDPNPVPLPPRDGKKHIKTNAKRHVRKYPLIIPANGVQRTLNKVTEKTPNEEEQKWPTSNHGNDKSNGNNGNGNNLQRITHEVVAAVRPTSLTNATTSIANSSNNGGSNNVAIYQNGVIAQKLKEAKAASKAEHDYQNLDSSGKSLEVNTSAINSDDTASLQFESIMEADFDKNLVLQSPDVTDGFYSFSIQKEHYNKGKSVDYNPDQISGLYVNEDELRNLDIDRSVKLQTPPTTNARKKSSEALKPLGKDPLTTTTAAALPSDTIKPTSVKCATSDNELAGNSLFKKVRQSIDQAMSQPLETITLCASSTAMAPVNPALETLHKSTQRQQTEAEYFAATAARLADSNSVSCEDLLEFADQKPKGRERGVDSDEVRIMMKVLGTQCTTTRCLASLDFIDWDVHKAIKLIKLQNILPTSELSFADAGDALQQCEWDLHMTAMKLRGVKT